MNIESMLKQLRTQRDALNRLIAVAEDYARTGGKPRRGRPPKYMGEIKRRGRPPGSKNRQPIPLQKTGS